MATRIVFAEEFYGPAAVQVVAFGDVTHDMLDALAGYIERQRKRLGPRIEFVHNDAAEN